jgi:GNAT superfamily N-acetyltransferase
VVDQYQGQGIGAVLMRHIAILARNAGLTDLIAEVGMSRRFVELEKRPLPRLMLSGDGLASKDAV